MSKNKPNGSIHRISISSKKGDKKYNVQSADIETGAGIVGDCHARTDRPISLLPLESFGKLEHPDLNIKPGDFAENLTTAGLNYSGVEIGSHIKIGDTIKLEVIQLGKTCHHGCIIRETVGDCIMPREGVFAKVLSGGKIKIGDSIKIMDTK